MNLRRRLMKWILSGNPDGWLVVKDDGGTQRFKSMSYNAELDAYRVELDDGVRYFEDPNDSLRQLDGVPVGFADTDACEIVDLDEKIRMEVNT